MELPQPRWTVSARFWWRIFLALAIAGAGWRLIRFAVAMPVWGDEAMLGLNIVGRDFYSLLLPLDHHQVAPVLYLWLQKAAALVLGANEYSMRLVALVEGLAAMGVLAVVFRRVLPPPEAVFAFGVVAVGTYSVRHCVELKPYAQDLLASSLVWWGLVWYSEKPAWRRCLALAGLLAVAVIASFPGIFTAGGAVLAAAVLHRASPRPAIARLAVLSTSTLAGFALVYFLSLSGQISRHEAGMTAYWAGAFPPNNLPEISLWVLNAHTGNLMAHPFGGKNFASSLTAMAALAGLMVLVRRGNRVWLTLILAPFVLTFVAAAFHLYPYGGSARVSQHLVPAIAILAGAGIWLALRAAASLCPPRLSAPLVAGLMLALAAGGATWDLAYPYKIRGLQEARLAVHAWMADLRPSDRIECLTPPAGWDPCMLWLFLPASERFHGRGWPGDSLFPAGRIWVISGDQGVDFPALIKARWPEAKILRHRTEAFSLIPPDPRLQRFEQALLGLP